MNTINNLERFMLDISTNAILEVDYQGNITFFNKKAAYIFHDEQTPLSNISEIFDFQTLSVIKEHIYNTFHQNYAHNFNIEIHNRFYNLFIHPYQGNVVLCLEDISERKHLSHHLHELRQRLEFAERTAKIGYWELDLDSKQFFWSSEMYKIFGITSQEIHQKKNLIREQILSEDLPMYKSKLDRLIKNGTPVEGMLRIRRKNGYIAYCLFKAGRISDEKKQRIAGTFQDISSLIEIQNSLEEAKQQAEASNKAKSYFLAQASHDLRHPMQALQMFIELLKEENNTPSQKNIIDKIEDSAIGLKSLLDNLLDISRLDSNSMIVETSIFDASKLICRLCQEYKAIAETKGIKVRCNLHRSVVETDSMLLERLLRNLLSNALKYSKDKILISCYPQKEITIINIIDNGVGINKEESKLIFDEFYQSKSIKDNRNFGAGLGLSIVKKITKLIGAEVKIRSVEKKYTAFSVIIKSNK